MECGEALRVPRRRSVARSVSDAALDLRLCDVEIASLEEVAELTESLEAHGPTLRHEAPPQLGGGRLLEGCSVAMGPRAARGAGPARGRQVLHAGRARAGHRGAGAVGLGWLMGLAGGLWVGGADVARHRVQGEPLNSEGLPSDSHPMTISWIGVFPYLILNGRKIGAPRAAGAGPSHRETLPPGQRHGPPPVVRHPRPPLLGHHLPPHRGACAGARGRTAAVGASLRRRGGARRREGSLSRRSGRGTEPPGGMERRPDACGLDHTHGDGRRQQRRHRSRPPRGAVRSAARPRGPARARPG